MWSRRAWLAALAGAPAARAACSPPAVRDLAWSDLPPKARELAGQLGLAAPGWEAYREAQADRLAGRIIEGSAEHVIYYALQSTRFTAQPPLAPALLARESPERPTPEAARRLAEFAATLSPPRDRRHRWIAALAASLSPEWTLERAYRHTMSFLAAKELGAPARAPSAGERQRALDLLYQQRGASSDTAPSSTAVLDAALAHLRGGAPVRSVLLAGPGLDLTRREEFSDSLPLRSYQADALRRAFPAATLGLLDVRPEVLGALAEEGYCPARADLTTTTLARPSADLAVATNLLLYFEETALLTAMASLAVALAPGGYLIHNDMRFAAKVFGETLGLPVVHFAPVRLGFRGRVEQMDRLVIHRRARA